jgi:hypothetical protein
MTRVERDSERIEAIKELLVERDQRYEQRFTDARQAVNTAFAAQQLGLSAALESQKGALAAALVATEKASRAEQTYANDAARKAESATERRFEGMDKFRSSQEEQQRALMPRLEVEVLLKGLTEKISSNQEAIRHQAELSNNLFARKEGQEKGTSAGWAMAIGIIGLITAVLSIALMLRK